ncbi:MAG: hypothetical protein V4772_28135 [Pseudomonadota bacterium]
MKKVLVLSAAAAAGLLSFNASAMDIMARVVSSTPVVQQVAVPRQVCNNQQVVTEAPKSGAGALIGAVAGGAAGNAIGNGSGRAVATMLGLMGGAILGNNIEGGGGQQVQNVQQCGTQTYYENRPSHYNVVYEYQGTQYNVQMANDPGQFVRLQVSPVGGISAPPQPAFQPQQPYQQPQQYQQPQYQQPQTYYPQAPAQPVYIQQPTSYIQPVAAPVVYAPAPVYYSRPYYAPSYAPIGLSLNFGYSRGFGHGHGGRWR